MTDNTKALSVVEYFNAPQVEQNIQQVLKERTPQFIASVVSLTNANEKLKLADKRSLMAACLTAASMNLPINSNLGFAYIIPYKQEDGTYLAQFQMGYKGFVQLAIRSGQYKTINATDIREGEIKKIDRLSGDVRFSFLEADREKAHIVGYVAYFKLKNGFSKMLYMTKDELNAHGLKYSQNFKQYKSGLWADDFDSMAKKTVLKLLLSKFGALDTNLEKAIESDQAVIDQNGEATYLDNQKSTPVQLAEEKERARILTHISNANTLDELTNPECEAAVKGLNDPEVIELYVQRKEELSQGAA